MRHLLVDRARSRLRAKRTMPIEILDSADSFEMTVQANDAIEMDDLLKRLAQEDPRSAEVLELHYFAGLTAERIGQHLGIDRRTVHRDLDFAKAFVRAHWPRENC